LSPAKLDGVAITPSTQRHDWAVPFLKSLSIAPKEWAVLNEHPFDVPSIAAMVSQAVSLRFDRRVTFFVGDNGSGKSTLLEALAVHQGMNPEGGTKGMQFSNRDDTVSPLRHHLRVRRSHHTPEDAFFLRAESFFNVATAIENYGTLSSYGSRSLHDRSHGESFIDLLVERFQPRGLYLLDEPEAALSVHGQLQFLVRLHDLVEQGCQFVIATHSPLLMAYPDATIYEFAEAGPAPVGWSDIDTVHITRDFLDDPQGFMAELLTDE
jgi:predicted ATPase